MGTSNITVLLIEDNEDHAELITRAFHDSGNRFNLTNTTCLADARDWLSEHNPEIVITDIKLPDGRGTDLLAIPEDVTRFPIIVMTSYGSELIAADSIKKGAIEYLRKSNEILQTMPQIVLHALEKWSHIVERRNAELALRESETKYRELVNSVGDGIVKCDESFKLTFVNNKFCEMLGYSEEELLGQLSRIFVMEDQIPIINDQRTKLQTGCGDKFEIDLKNKNGSRVHTVLSPTMIVDSDGKYIGSNAVISDISDRKIAQEEIKAKNIELESALKIQKELLSMVSHELRTPLVPIVGYSDLLLSETFGTLPEESVEPVRVIRDRAQDLVKIVEDLFIITDLERDNLKLKLEHLSVAANIREMIVEFESYTHTKDVSIEWAGKDFTVCADRTRLHQIIGNLIDNAIKYSSDRVKIIIDSQVVGEMGIVTVKDNGIGISEHNQPHVFDRFYQAEEIDTREHGGSGLGLAITRELVELMGGTISVESEPGVGSTFSFSLPITV